MEILKAENLFFSIGETSILNDISIALQSGETVGVIGPNGSGKTTLFNCLSGFCRARKGSIAFKGRDITQLPAFSRAALGIGRVFQNPGVFREMTLLENVLTALESRSSLIANLIPGNASERENRGHAFDLLKDIGLDSKAGQKAGSLSGGQMRLLEIIRTLAFGAELFLLDEPTAGVSPKMKEDVSQLIRKVQALNKTILVIEHDVNFIQKFCSRIIVLNEGQVVIDDTPQRVRESPLLQEIYFGSASAAH